MAQAMIEVMINAGAAPQGMIRNNGMKESGIIIRWTSSNCAILRRNSDGSSVLKSNCSWRAVINELFHFCVRIFIEVGFKRPCFRTDGIKPMASVSVKCSDRLTNSELHHEMIGSCQKGYADCKYPSQMIVDISSR